MLRTSTVTRPTEVIPAISGPLKAKWSDHFFPPWVKKRYDLARLLINSS